MQSAVEVKENAHKLIDMLPDNTTWEEVAYRVEVRASIEAGLKDVREGRVVSQEDMIKEFGIED